MGDRRKLQAEIDRTLKKIEEGVEVFDRVFNKVQDAENQNQKEKYESDLKKEIKKLQRYRDQVKTWAGSNDIKDKGPLLEARKTIEREMERFKICEKETKTKAFSKEGLMAARDRKDPKEKAREEANDWLNHSVDELAIQIEAFEAEIESVLAEKTKKSKSRPPRLGHLEESITRHHQHVQRLELVLRLIDNDALNPDDVTDLKDLVEDYLERNQEDWEEFGDVEDMYADLNLDELDSVTLHEVVHAPPKIVDKVTEKKAEVAAAAEAAAAMATAALQAQVHAHAQAVQAAAQAQVAAEREMGGGGGGKKLVEKPIPTPVTGGKHLGVLGGGGGLPAPLGLAGNAGAGTPTLVTGGTASVGDGFKEPPPPVGLQGRGGAALPEPKGREGTLGGNGGSWGAPGGGGAAGSAPGFPSLQGSQGGGVGVPETATAEGALAGEGLRPQQSWTFPPDSSSGGGGPGVGGVGASAGGSVGSTGEPPVYGQPPQATGGASNNTGKFPLPMQPQQRLQQQQQDVGGTLRSNSQQHQHQQLAQQQQQRVPPGSPGMGSGVQMLQSQGSPSGRGSLPTPQFHTLGGGGSGGKEGGGEGEGGSGEHEASTEVNNDEVFDLPGGLADLADPGVGGSIVSGHGGSGFGTATLTATASGSEGTTGAGAGGGGGGSGGAGVGGFGGDNPGVLLGGILHHDPSVNLRLLESSYRNLPQPGDGVWTRRRRERPHVPIPPSYPTQLPPVLENPALFERLDADALFFTFYYQQGTAQQYLAARELKRANWRFHKKYATWFARQEEPAVSTDLYEQGSYIYFDFTLNAGANDGSNAPGGWCQRSKADFVFEYQQLESEMN